MKTIRLNWCECFNISMGQDTWNQLWMQMQLTLLYIGTLMPCTKSIKIVGDRLDVWWLWARELWSVLLTKWNAILKAPPKQSWLLFMSNYLMWFGQDICWMSGVQYWRMQYQDNMSALSLEMNGRVSSSKWSKHIKAKYFLIKDYYDVGEVDLKYCSTDTMWADILTKTLQGQKIRYTRVSCKTAQEMMMIISSKKKTNKDKLVNQWTIKSRLMLHRRSVLKNDKKL